MLKRLIRKTFLKPLLTADLYVTFILFSCILSNRYLLVECNEGKDIKEGAMYLNVMRRFSQALMKVGVRQMKN